ncbi:MAG TPA: hypothetical protein DCQ93_05195 [Bacteroidetes bacterium]|nr:hypothetical protein [Bacteroidota bacterium]
MKSEHYSGVFKSKNNFDYKEDIIPSPELKIKHQSSLRAAAELTLDSEIRISSIIPFDGELRISYLQGKKDIELFSKKVTKGFFMTTIPVSVHDEISKLNFQLKSHKSSVSISIEVLRQEFLN